MGRKSRLKPNAPALAAKKKQSTPDNYYRKGPFEMARFGRLVVVRNNMTPEQHRLYLEANAKRLPEVIATIDTHVAAIVRVATGHDPLSLLQRGYWEQITPMLLRDRYQREKPEEVIAQRMVDYVQGIIAAAPAPSGPLPPVTDEAWGELVTQVTALFTAINRDYVFCRTSDWHVTGAGLPDGRHEFFVRALLMWCNVTGHRHHHQEIAYLRELMTPHSAVLQRLWGIDAEGLVAGFGRILHSLSRGPGEALGRLHAAYRAYAGEAAKAGPGAEPEVEAAVTAGLQADPELEQAADQFFGTGLFRVDGCLPEPLLRALSWQPGECREFLDGRPFSGWPTRVWPRTLRPFLAIDGSYYCFDVHSLFDHVYRVLQRIILAQEPGYRHAWDEAQKTMSEALPLRLFRQLCPGATTWSSVFYKTRELDPLGARKWCELDGLVCADDHLFIVEVKAGVFKLAPPESDFDAYVRSIERLIFDPAEQGTRFLQWLDAEGRIDLFDAKHVKIGELRRDDFAHVTVCAISLDPFTELSAKSHHLRHLVGRPQAVPFWAISLGDLQTYTELFDNPLAFLHYVEMRGQAICSAKLVLDDEFDHYGMYLKHNQYDVYAAEVGGETRVSWNGYRAVVDEHFDRLGHNEASPLPRQEMPAAFSTMIALLARGTHPSRRRVASLLLNISGDEKDRMAATFTRTLAEQRAARRPKPFSIHGEHLHVTFYCWQDGVLARSAVHAAKHAQGCMLAAGENERLLLELFYDGEGALQELEPTWFSADALTGAARTEVEAYAQRLKRERIGRVAATQGRVGRNETCPCGSGKKFKHCCLT